VGALTCGAREKDRAIQAVISGRGKANVVLKSAGCMRKAADVHCTPWQATHKDNRGALGACMHLPLPAAGLQTDLQA
jgi:hypothetical protein